MSRRIVVEERCEHGKVGPCSWPLHHDYDPLPLKCPGGSRTVLDEIPDEWVQLGVAELFDRDDINPEVKPWHHETVLAILEAAVFGGTP